MTHICKILVFIGLTACSNRNIENYPDKLFKEKYSISGKELNINPYKLSSPGKMIIFENEECIIKENHREEFLLEKIFYNIDSLIPLAKKGNGPNEYFNLRLMQKNNTQSFSVFDNSKRKVYTLNLNDSILDSNTLEKNVIHAINTKIGYITPDCSKNADKNTRYSIFTSSGNLIKSFGMFPDDDNSTPNNAKLLAYQGLMNYNLSLNRFASISTSGIIFEIYQLGVDTITPILLLHRKLPSYNNDSKDNIIGIKHNDDNLFGFIDIYSTNEFIYLLYSGKKPSEYRNEGMEAVRRTRSIHVFDWNGKAICQLNTDIDIFNICVCSNNKQLIALGWENDYNLYSFDLPIMNDK